MLEQQPLELIKSNVKEMFELTNQLLLQAVQNEKLTILEVGNIAIPNLTYEHLISDYSKPELREYYHNVVEPLLKERYLHKGEINEIDMFQRVSCHVSNDTLEKALFFNMMRLRLFIPATPTLMNAGRQNSMLSSCFVMIPEDDMVSIADYWKDMTMVQKYGGGVGVDWSNIRPIGSEVAGTGGVASGFKPFMDVANSINRAVKQGSVRSGANAATMRVTHPEIMSFIDLKNTQQKATEYGFFNIAVTVYDNEFQKMINGEPINLVFNDKYYDTVNATDILYQIGGNGWKTGDPSIDFLDRINEFWRKTVKGRLNPYGVPYKDKITHNPCGEQSLPSYSACNLGSLNLFAFYNPIHKSMNFELFRQLSRVSLRFLDCAVDTNWFPSDKITAHTKHLRNVGLGFMGLADILYLLEIDYGSSESVSFAEKISTVMTESAYQESVLLADEKGRAPVFEEYKDFPALNLRNSDLTCVAPTGSIAMLSLASHGIEPYFFLEYEKLVYPKGTRTVEKYIKIKPPAMMMFPDRKTPKTAHEVSPHQHIDVLGIVSQNVTNAVSKTINLPEDATVYDIVDIYKYAFDKKCKSVTIFRDNCRSDLAIKKIEPVNLLSNASVNGTCPACGVGFVYSEDGCKKCDNSECEWSSCAN